MQHTVLACMKHKIAVGRPPLLSGYARLSKMRDQNVARGLTAAIRYQVGVLKACLDAEGIALHHVKSQGILYGMMYRDRDIAGQYMRPYRKGQLGLDWLGRFKRKLQRRWNYYSLRSCIATYSIMRTGH
ncbi:hypothetical protein K469DRAFT_801904 [Zopfia rhizophila CBS 207.26]|uniref:Uncharacterized protein n=1 Tax=Zopfia rhizophila CBS 207.26 TaxID=1314779 RepID=A0A6A6D7W6_9PEZI|nr:hypothetical protein K469DRAFT_801904 [Zopfia rhizophila CBS 207.26]